MAKKTGKGGSEPAFNEFQRLILDKYENGEFAYITTRKEVEECGDGFLEFLLREVSTESDALSVKDAVNRLSTMMRETSELIDAFEEAFS